MEKILTQLGLPAALAAVLAYVWAQGAYQYLPAAVAAAVWAAVYLLKLHHDVPFVKGFYAELDELNQGKQQQVSSKLSTRIKTLHTQLNQNPTWSRWLAGAERAFSASLGPEIWTLQAFNRLLLFALIYPLLMLLLMWVLLDQGMLGQTEVLPAYGAGAGNGVKRFGAAVLLLCPLLPWVWYANFHQDWMARSEKNLTIGILVVSVAAVGIALVVVSVLRIYFDFGAVAGAVAAAAAVIGAVAVAAVAAAAAAAAVVVAFVLLLLTGIGRIQREFLRVATLVLGLLTLSGIAVVAVPPLVPASAVSANSQAFVLLVFFSILPVCNAVFDWVSLGVTRQLLRWYAQGGRNSAWLIVADIAVAAVLTIALYGVVLGLLLGMQRLGWGIDALALIRRFHDNPFDPQVSWIALMAITNLLPTLYHLALCVLGWLTRGITVQRADLPESVASLAQALGIAGSTPSLLLSASGQPVNGSAGSAPQQRAPLSKPVLDGMFNFLYVDHWMALLMVIALVCAAWEPYLWLLGRCLAVFV